MIPAPDLSIAEVRSRVGAGELSAVELAEIYLRRIDAFDGALNVYRTVTRELALAQAAEVDAAAGRGDPPGPLAGVPVALKDNIEVAGVRMTAGTSYLEHNVATGDAPVYERLRAAGAVLLGKLHMSEWAIGGTTQNVHFGDCHNPWDPTRVSGGSSGGSGAAIAADLALATLGTDTGGSVRLPASLNGCCGLRGSAGLVPNRGSIPVAWTFDAIGPLARRAADVGELMQVIAGYDPDDAGSANVPVGDLTAGLGRGVEGLRVGLLSGYWLEDLEPGFRTRLRDAAATLEGLGATVEEVALPGHAEAIEWTADLLLAEAAWYHRDRLRDEPGVFAPDVLVRLQRGAAVSGPRYGGGRQWQREWRRRVLQALEGHDLLLCAGAGRPAPPAVESDPLEMTGVLARFVSMWVLSRTPALIVPCGFVGGLPVAMQMIGRPFAEGTLLRAADAYQHVTDWHLRRPDAEAWTQSGSPNVPEARSSATSAAE